MKGIRIILALPFGFVAIVLMIIADMIEGES